MPTVPGSGDATDATSPLPVSSAARARMADARRIAPLRFRDASRYERIAEHGRGGIGRVVRAHDKELGRDVALKELLESGRMSETRFLREALITARLEHPGIVPVHEAGRWTDGTPFYAMKLVAGRSLKDLIGDAATLGDRLALLGNVIAVGDAIAYAHDRKIIHRDLKPSNVIVGEFGETVVIDWGLAKVIDEPDEPSQSDLPRAPTDDGATIAGSVLGTPAYMAPEQRRGQADERSDIYTLGGILYQVLTGTPPHPTGRGELRARAFPRDTPRDLIAIVERAMAREPERRYAAMPALVDDLRRFQRHAPVAARRYSIAARLALGFARYRTFALVSVAALSLLSITLAISVAKISSQRAEAIAARGVAEQARRHTEQAKDDLALQHAELLLRSDPTAAVAALADYHGADPVRRARLVAEAHGRGVARAVVAAHSDAVWFAAGDKHGAIYSIAEDQTVRVTRSGRTTTLASDVSTALAVAFARDRRLVAYTAAPSGIVLFDLAAQSFTRIATDSPAQLALSPDESQLAELSPDGKLRVWSIASPSAPVLRHEADVPGAADVTFWGASRVVVLQHRGLQVIALDGGKPTSAALPAVATVFAADDTRIAVGDTTGTLTLLDTALAPQASRLVCHKNLTSVKFVPHSGTLAFSCLDGGIGIARHTGKELAVTDMFATTGAGVSAIPDAQGNYVVAFDEAGTLYAFDLRTRLLSRYEGQGASIVYAAPGTADFPYLISGDAIGTYRVWSPPDHTARVVLHADKPVVVTRFSPDSRRLAAGGVDGVARSVDLATGDIAALSGHAAIVRRVLFSPDGGEILTSSADGSVRLFSPDGSARGVLKAEHGTINAADFTDGGRQVASIGDDGRLVLWEPATDARTVLFQAESPLALFAILGATGRFVVADARGGVWDVARDRPARKLDSPGGVVTAMRASRDAALVAMGTDTGSVVVYRTADWSPLASGRATRAIRQIQFDPANHLLAFAAEDGHVRIVSLDGRTSIGWDDIPARARDLAFSPDGNVIGFLTTGATWLYSIPLRTWAYARDHEAEAASCTFSPDSKSFASCDRYGVVTLRDVDATFAKFTHIEPGGTAR